HGDAQPRQRDLLADPHAGQRQPSPVERSGVRRGADGEQVLDDDREPERDQHRGEHAPAQRPSEHRRLQSRPEREGHGQHQQQRSLPMMAEAPTATTTGPATPPRSARPTTAAGSPAPNAKATGSISSSAYPTGTPRRTTMKSVR